MTLLRMDNILVVVDDLKAAIAFFADIGMQLEGEATVEGPWIDRIVGFDGSKCDVAMLRTPDGHGRDELEKYHAPPAVRTEPQDAPVNALGLRRIMYVRGPEGIVIALAEQLSEDRVRGSCSGLTARAMTWRLCVSSSHWPGRRSRYGDRA